MRGSSSLPRIVVKDVYRALALVLEQMYPPTQPLPGVHPSAVLGRGVVLGSDVSIGAGAVIGDRCLIGDGCILHPQVTLYPGVRVGARTIIHSGARIGSDGFGYVPVEGKHQKVPQVGECIIGEDVEIGANTTIDRGSIGATEIGDDVKIDNLVHIGHNVRVGAHSIIVAQTGISGSVTVGQRVTLAGQVGVVGHLRIADNVTIGGKSVVWGSIDEPGVYSGNPARPHKESLRTQAAVARLPELMKRLRALEHKILGKSRE